MFNLNSQEENDVCIQLYSIWHAEMIDPKRDEDKKFHNYSPQQWPIAVSTMVSTAIKTFLKYKDSIDSIKKDIKYWLNHPFEEFQSFVYELDLKEERSKHFVSDVNVIFENENLKVIKPNTHKAARDYGCPTWLVTYLYSMAPFHYYNTEPDRMFYFLSKLNNNSRLIFHTTNNRATHVLDENGQQLTDEQFFEKLSVDLRLSLYDLDRLIVGLCLEQPRFSVEAFRTGTVDWDETKDSLIPS